MNSLTNKCLQAFLCNSYGEDVWANITATARIRPDAVLVWKSRPDATTGRLIAAAAKCLEKMPGELLEDLGEWLTRQEQIRRLLRFSGATFDEFVTSLQDISGRINLVLPDLGLSELLVAEMSPTSFRITSVGSQRRAMRVIVGVLRGMADDFGTLAVITHRRGEVEVNIAMARYSSAKEFELVAATI